MAERTVQLVIKVDDSDVKSADRSLERLKISAQQTQSEIGKPTNIIGGSKVQESEEQQRRLAAWMQREMPAASKEATTAIDGVTAASGEMSSGMAAAGVSGMALLGVAAVLVVGLAVLVAGLLGVTAGVTRLAKGFSDAGIEAVKMQRETGLATDTIIALEHEAARTGENFGVVEGAVNKFRETVGKAAAGNVEAKESLKLLGLDGTKAINDIDGAFRTALTAIVAVPNEFEQARLGVAAFGDDWKKIAPLVREFHGDVGEAMKRAEELGIQLSGKDVAAAKEFNKAFEDAKAAVKGLELAFGREFLNTVNSAITSFTNWIVSNKETIREWAVGSARIIGGIYDALKKIVDFVAEHPWLIRGALDVATGGAHEVFRQALPTIFGGGQSSPFMPGDTTTASTGQPDTAALQAYMDELKRRQEEAKKAYEADLDAAVTYFEKERSELEKYAKGFYAEAAKMFEQHGDENFFEKQVREMLASVKPGMDAIEARLKEFEQKRDAAKGASAMQQSVTAQAQRGREKDDAEASGKIQRDMADAIAKYKEKKEKETLEGQKKAMEDELSEKRVAAQRVFQLNEEINKGLAAQKQREFDQGKVTERVYLNYLRDIRLGALDQQKRQLEDELKTVTGDIQKRPDLTELKKQKANLEGQLKINAEQYAQIQPETGLQQLTAEEKIREHINKLLTDDNKLIKERRDLAQTSEEDQLVSSITAMQDQLANGGANDALKIYEAHLRDIVDDRNAELNAVIAIQHAQYELSKAMEVSNTEVRAGIYQHMAEQKTLQQATIDGWNETYDAINKVVNGPLEALNQKTKGFLAFIIRPLEAMQTQALNNIWGGVVDKIFGADNPLSDALKSTGNPMLDESKKQTDYLKQIVINTGGGAGVGGINPTTGGIFGSIFGGGGMGPGGTPFFNPTQGGGLSAGGIGAGPHGEYGGGGDEGGGSGGGMFGGFGHIFDPQKNPITGKENSALAGKLGGIGAIASMIGQFVPGRGGRMLRYAGMGMQIGSMFGPWGAAIGGAAGAIFGLFGHGDDAIGKLRSAVQATYGITVHDNSILNALKQIGEGYFGRGNVGRNATAVVSTDEARDLIMNYAQSTGQHSSKLDNMFHTDPNWSGNQFGSAFSGFGGVPSVSQSRYVAPVNGSRWAATPSVSGDQATINASHAEALHRIADELARLKVKPAGVIVREGAGDAGPAIAAATADHYNNDFSSRERTARTVQY